MLPRSIDARTHYLPYFTTRTPEGHERAACGTGIVSLRQLAPVGVAPTCGACALWLEMLQANTNAPVSAA